LVRLDKVIAEVIPELELMAKNKSINLSVEVRGKASLSITTDALIVKEVVTNLASNAIKYTPEAGKVQIIMRPRRADIMVEISDSGWGIPKFSQDQVFSKFFRAQNIVERETTGTGLGLYLVRGLLDALEGSIWFNSEEGVGTSFYFTLPRGKRSLRKVNKDK
jgi:two-component system phosphate regulon sensor histidine kinase PhoR